MDLYRKVIGCVLTLCVVLMSTTALLLAYGWLTGPPPGVAHYQIEDGPHSDSHINSTISQSCYMNGEKVNCSKVQDRFPGSGYNGNDTAEQEVIDDK